MSPKPEEPPEEPLDEPIELIESLPLFNTNASLIKIASKVNEVIRNVNKGKGKPVRYINIEASLGQ